MLWDWMRLRKCLTQAKISPRLLAAENDHGSLDRMNFGGFREWKAAVVLHKEVYNFMATIMIVQLECTSELGENFQIFAFCILSHRNLLRICYGHFGKPQRVLKTFTLLLSLASLGSCGCILIGLYPLVKCRHLLFILLDFGGRWPRETPNCVLAINLSSGSPQGPVFMGTSGWDHTSSSCSRVCYSLHAHLFLSKGNEHDILRSWILPNITASSCMGLSLGDLW